MLLSGIYAWSWCEIDTSIQGKLVNGFILLIEVSQFIPNRIKPLLVALVVNNV